MGKKIINCTKNNHFLLIYIYIYHPIIELKTKCTPWILLEIIYNCKVKSQD